MPAAYFNGEVKESPFGCDAGRLRSPPWWANQREFVGVRLCPGSQQRPHPARPDGEDDGEL